jgi:hypothetical protein
LKNSAPVNTVGAHNSVVDDFAHDLCFHLQLLMAAESYSRGPRQLQRASVEGINWQRSRYPVTGVTNAKSGQSAQSVAANTL